MLCWCLAVFLLCCPAPLDGRPAAPSSRLKRSVTHAQLMHDKGRALQDFKRRMWLQELLDEVHTAEIRELAVRTTSGGGGGGGSSTSASTTGSTLHSKPPGGTKNLPLGFGAVDEREVEEAEEPNLPQETHKSQPFREEVRAAGKRRKKSRSGRRREGDKRRRRARSLPWSLGDEPGSGLHLEWRSLLGLQRAVL